MRHRAAGNNAQRVLSFYRKTTSKSRAYFIALAVLDLLSVWLGLAPKIALHFMDENQTKVWLETVNIFIAITTFRLYLYPMLFLAVDRILVVKFPLTFTSYTRKVRGFKSCVLALNFLVNLLDITLDKVFAKFFLGLRILNICWLVCILSITTFLYVYMAILILMSKKMLQGSRNSGNRFM